jgi:hypothetical protein
MPPATGGSSSKTPSAAFDQFKKDLLEFNEFWTQQADEHPVRRLRTIQQNAGELLKHLERYLQFVSAEVKPSLLKASGKITYEGGKPLQHYSPWSVTNAEPTISLSHSSTLSDTFSTGWTWSQCYQFVYALRCVTGHGNPADTLMTGCLKRDRRATIRKELTSYIIPPGTDTSKGNPDNITLADKRKSDWAKDVLNVLDHMESQLPDPKWRTGSDLHASSAAAAAPPSQEDNDSTHWFYRTWLPRMVKALAYSHVVAVGKAGGVRRTGPGAPGPRAHRPSKRRAGAISAAAAPAPPAAAAAAPAGGNDEVQQHKKAKT